MGKLIVTNTSVLLPDMTIARGQTVETENGIISAIRPYQGRRRNNALRK